jgi:hypothetical protein
MRTRLCGHRRIGFVKVIDVGGLLYVRRSTDCARNRKRTVKLQSSFLGWHDQNVGPHLPGYLLPFSTESRASIYRKNLQAASGLDMDVPLPPTRVAASLVDYPPVPLKRAECK